MGTTFIEDELLKRSSSGILTPMREGDVMQEHCAATFIVAASNSIHPGRADYVCDGVDDQVTIQAALDELPSSIFFQGGQYLFGDTTVIPNMPTPPKLYGDCRIGTEFKLADGANCDMFTSAAGSSSFSQVFENLYLNGNKANNVSGNGIVMDASSVDGLINHCYVGQFAEDGIVVNNAWFWRINRCVLEENVGYAIKFPDANDDARISNSKCLYNGHALYSKVQYLKVYSNHFACNKLNQTIHLAWGDDSMIFGNSFNDNCKTAGGACDIRLDGTVDRLNIFGNSFRGRSQIAHAIQTWTDVHDNIWSNNTFAGYTGTIFDDTGSGNIKRNNIGVVTENSGTATLLAAGTSIVVPHGLAVTPVAGDIVVTPMEAWGNMTTYYIGNYGATNFTIYSPIAPGQDVDFAWKAIVL